MATKKIGASIVLEGEKSYRDAIKSIREEQAQLRSEMKLCNEQFSDSQNSLDALRKKHEILSETLESQQRKVEATRKVLEEAHDAQEKSAQKVDELKRAYEAAQKTMESMEKNSSATNEEMVEQRQTLESLKSQLTLAEQGYEKISSKVTSYQTALNYAEAEMAHTNKELQETDKYMDEAEKSTDGCAKSIDQYGKNVQESTEKTSIFADVLKAELLSEAIVGGIKKLANGVKEMATAAVETGSTFEASMSQVAATMGITAEEIKNGSKEYELLKKAAKECGETTMFSASEAADALNYLALAGYDAEKSVETLPKVLTLAAAGNLELATASDMVTDAMAALGMQTDDLDRFIDEMAKTSQKSNTSVEQLGEATLVCAGTVSMAGQSIETMNTELGILANNGIKGSEAGTKMRNILLSLVAPTDTASDAIESLKLNVVNADGSVRDLNDIMVDLNAILSTMSQEQRTQVISKIFNKTDISAVNALLKGTGTEFSNLMTEIENATGAADAMAETLQDNLKGKVTILQSSLEGLGIAAYDIFEDTMKDCVDGATDAVGRLQESISDGEMGVSLRKLSGSIGEFAKESMELATNVLPSLISGMSWVLDNAGLIAGGVAGIATAHMTYTKIIPTMTMLVDSYKALKTTTDAANEAQRALNATTAANPYALIASAVIGLAAAFGTLYTVSKATEEQEVDYRKTIENEIGALNEKMNVHKQEVATVKSLSSELLELNKQETLTNDEQVRMNMLVGELNEIIPDLNLQLDKQGHLIGASADELERYCDLSIKSYEIELMKEDLTEIMKEHYELQKEYNTALEEQNELQQTYDELLDQINERGYMVGSEGYDFDNISNQLDQATEKTNNYKTAMDELEIQYYDMQEDINFLTEEIDAQTESLEESAEAAYATSTAIVQYGNRNVEVTQSVADQWDTLQEAYAEAYEEATKSITGQVALFEKLEVASDLTTKQMLGNLESQTSTYTQYTDDLIKATDLMEQDTTGSFSSIVQGIMDMGIDGAGYLHELVTAAETDSESFSAILEEFAEMQEARTTLETTMADIQTGYSDWIEENLGILTDFQLKRQVSEDEAMQGWAASVVAGFDNMKESIDDSSILIEGASVAAMESMVTSIQGSLGINADGDYQTMMDIGSVISQSTADGITDNSEAIADALQTAIDDAADHLDMSSVKNAIDKAIGEALD